MKGAAGIPLELTCSFCVSFAKPFALEDELAAAASDAILLCLALLDSTSLGDGTARSLRATRPSLCVSFTFQLLYKALMPLLV